MISPNNIRHNRMAISLLTMLSVIAYFIVYYLDTHIASCLGSLEYGGFKVKLRVIHNIVHCMILGQDGILINYMSIYKKEHNTILFNGFTRWLFVSIGLRISLLWLCCMMAIGAGYWFNQPSWMQWGIWLAFSPFILLLYFSDKYFLHLKKYYIAYLPRNILHPLLLMVFLWLLPQYLTTTSILMAYGFIYVAIATILFLFMLLQSPIPYSAYSYTPTYHKIWWRESWYYWTSIVILQTSRSLNIFLLDYLGNDARDVGYYSAILTVVLVLITFTKSLDNYLKPWISSHCHDHEVFFPILVYCNTIRCIIVSGLCSMVVLFAPWIMSNFGNDFVDYSNALQALMILYSLYTLGQPNLDLLSFSGNNQDTSKIMIAKLLSMLLLTILLVPHMGLWGCIWADGITSIMSILIATIRCQHHLGFTGWLLFIGEKKNVGLSSNPKKRSQAFRNKSK